MMKHIGLGAGSGMIAGALVGLCEAMYILGGASTGEYGALLYATILYGILGLCGGMGIGGGLWVLSLLKLKLADDRIFALGFLGIFFHSDARCPSAHALQSSFVSVSILCL